MNKKLIAILTLAVFMLTLMPMGAFATSNVKVNTVGAIPTITSTGTTDTLPQIRIDEDVVGNFKQGDVVVITLPSGIRWTTGIFSAVANYNTTAGVVGAANITGERISNTVAHFTIPAAVEAETALKVFMNINLGVVEFTNTTNTGEINLTAPGTAIPTTTIAVANAASRSVEATVITSSTRGTSGEFGTIRLTENSAGALRAGRTITLKVAGDFEFNKAAGAAGMDNDLGPGARGIELNSVAPVVGVDDTKVFEYTVGTVSTGGPGIIDIPIHLIVGADATVGDIQISLSGEVSSTLNVGKYADYGVNVTAAAKKEIIAGKGNQEAAKVTIKDSIAGSLIAQRTIVLRLPDGTRFAGGTVPTLTNKAGLPVASSSISTDGRTATYNLGTTPTGTTEFEYTPRIDVAPNFTGEVMLSVSGTAGAQGDVAIADIIAPVTVEAASTNIRIGVQNQPIGDILIKETKKEAIQRNQDLTLTLDNGVVFAKVPTVEIVEGNITFDSVTRTDGQIVLRFKSQSTTPSTIKISNVEVTTNRSVPEGDIKMTVAGPGVVVLPVAANSWLDDINRKSVGSFKVATVTSPAEDGVVQPVVMTVGSTVYTVDGVEMTMDVAPYVKTGRTFFPVRFVASAVGISADNVVWDSAQRTVTIFRGNRIVQVTIGSTTMLVNGIPLTMDVAPEITAGRTMLPIRFVAQGLNVNVTWDAATQTVTLN